MTTANSPQLASPPLARRFGAVTATLLVVASMIGTGVFTTTGLLLAELKSPLAVLLAWSLGGIISLCGALSYAELATSIASNGGEYRLLSDTFHPAVGFVAGWICLVVGFSAPIAASAMAFGMYLHGLTPSIPPVTAGVTLIVSLSILHAARVTAGGRVQSAFTLTTVILILLFIVGTAWHLRGQRLEPFEWPSAAMLASPSFAVSVIFVYYAYTGWNAAVYVSGEVHEPSRNLPLALGLGTTIVALLYLCLNLAFLLGTPSTLLSGIVDVGNVAAMNMFGSRASRAISLLIALALASSVSALVVVGPRVYEAMGRDYRALALLRMRPGGGGPYASIALQGVVATVLLVTLSFDALLLYVGITLSASAALTVSAVFVRRRRHGAPLYRAWGYPITPLLFLLFVLWMIARSIMQRPVIALLAILTVTLGLALYLLVKRRGYCPNYSDSKGPGL